MMNMTPQFVSTEDFLNYWGVNLNEKLRGNANESNKGDAFLKRIEDRLMAWLDANTFRTYRWDDLKSDSIFFSDKQKMNWKLAILNQAMYVYRNSNIGLDSGYDVEKGVIAKKEELESIEICRPAIDYIKVAGLYNHVMSNRPRYTTLS